MTEQYMWKMKCEAKAATLVDDSLRVLWQHDDRVAKRENQPRVSDMTDRRVDHLRVACMSLHSFVWLPGVGPRYLAGRFKAPVRVIGTAMIPQTDTGQAARSRACHVTYGLKAPFTCNFALCSLSPVVTCFR